MSFKKCVFVLVPVSLLGCLGDPASTCGNGQIEDDREPCYDLITSGATGVGVNSLAAGDFDGDGVLDLATASFDTDDVCILVGLLEDFILSSFFSVGDGPNAVLAADFNNDGLPDLATGNDDSLSVLLSGERPNFLISFGAATSFSVEGSVSSLVAEDFNGDGSLDLAAATRDGSLSILPGDGAGSFAAPTTILETGGFTSILTGDFNNDGFLDLVTAGRQIQLASANNTTFGQSPGKMSVFLGDGAGSFATPINLIFEKPTREIAAADFNGDGLLDLATTTSDTGLSILPGDGTGSFGTPSTFPEEGNDPTAVAVVDFNRDGITDIAVTDALSIDEEVTGQVSILLGDGEGSFERSASFTVGDGPVSLLVEDFNGDGLPDFATANVSSNDVSLLLSNP